MNRIEQTFKTKERILNIYFTAGFPLLDDTLRVACALQEAGADMLEIGMPFSDPLADGPTIQNSSQIALENGMNLPLLFEQLKALRSQVEVPVLLMGYINPILQFGMNSFLEKCAEVGIDGLIIPDLPMQEYRDEYQSLFEEKGIQNIFLISPNTSTERIRLIDQQTNGFIYMVSSSSTTGAKKAVQEGQVAYYERIEAMGLKNPRLIGFGISNHETFSKACEYAQGAIIGSAFVQQLGEDASEAGINQFVGAIRDKLS